MDLNSESWRNLVFEGKNQRYGAYYLRKTSDKRHLQALFLSCCFVVLSVAALLYIQHSNNTDVISPEFVSPVDLSMLNALIVENQPNYKPKNQPENNTPKRQEPTIVKEEEIFEVQETPEDSEPVLTVENETDSLTDDSLPPEEAELTEPLTETITYNLDETTDPRAELQPLRTAILRYVYQHLKYPEVAYKQRIKGRVVCSFIVDKNGRISDIALVKGVYIFLDEEVLRVLASIPALTPVTLNGTPVSIKCYLPIVFAI
ncbi:MAG: TonB family protein [Dysgonamonadaceae bacterium]|jgi:protein TonB|nr:TonB family protein [Dysgonamonadaceae bacterium]